MSNRLHQSEGAVYRVGHVRGQLVVLHGEETWRKYVEAYGGMFGFSLKPHTATHGRLCQPCQHQSADSCRVGKLA
ncbi:hypothetical protein PSEUDO8Z_150040 [Pseudomonas sp. 8Z]|nr:hypothetical protein PSEUDO8Z_150040 [Pseudomonas sp. 8Z]